MLFFQNINTTNITRIRNGRVELVNPKTGSLIKTIYMNNSKAIDSDLNIDGKIAVITLENGNVCTYKIDGSPLKTIFMSGSNKANRARFDGTNVVIYLNNGKCQLTKPDGSPIKTF